MFITIVDKKAQEIDRKEVLMQEFCIGIMSNNELQENYEEVGIHPFAVEECIEQLKEIIYKALERVQQNATPERMVTGILDRLLFHGNEELMFTENIMFILEQEVTKVEEPERTSAELSNLRKRISTLKSFYEQMIDVGEGLQENTNDIFGEDELCIVKNFTMRAERMKE